MSKVNINHLTELGFKTMERIPPGTLLRVSWIDLPDENPEWGLNNHDFDDDDTDNIVMLVKWRPEVRNLKDVITFTCLWQDKLAISSSAAIKEIIKT